jgi:hypothetical protein
MDNKKTTRTRRTKYTFSLFGVNMNKINKIYNIAISSNIARQELLPENITKISDLYTEKHVCDDFFSFLDESKHYHKCLISMIDMSSKEKISRYNCFWDRNSFTTSPIGCPIRYIPSQAIKTYYSEISKDLYIIKENITNEKKQSIVANNDSRITIQENEYYECDGVFCSFNCVLAFIKDNIHNSMYAYSEMLLIKMYNDIYKTNINKIEPATTWRLLQEYGGTINIEKFRESFNKIDYEPHGIIHQKSIGKIFEEHLKF